MTVARDLADDTITTPHALQAWLADIFAAAGLEGGDARAVSRNLADAEVRGVLSHGVLLVPMYIQRIQRGVVNARYQPRVVRESAGAVYVDGDAGPGQSLLFDAMRRVEPRARVNGIALVSVTNSNHAGMLATYGFELARRGFASIVMTNAGPSVGAFGARGQCVGNNALCFTFPQGGEEPLCFDMATGQVATGKVRVLELRGERVPEGALVDRNGAETTDPSALRAGGWVLPLGGHKGFGLSVVVDMLTAVLSGGQPSAQVDNGPNSERLGLSHTVIGIDVAAVRGDETFGTASAAYAHLLRELVPMHSSGRVRAPGDIELERARANATGFAVHASVLGPAETCAAELGVGPLARRA